MAENTRLHPITIDLNQFKLHIALRNRIELTLHFNSPSRRFYLSVIAFVVNEMKRHGKITSIPLEGHHDLLALMNETIGGAAGSSEIETLLSRIYMKWQHALPNLEEAPLFTVLGKKKGYEEGISKTYHFTEAEKDSWANLFEYKGSHKHVRLKFAIDKIGASLNDIIIIYEDSLNADAWKRFISNLQEKKAEPDRPVSEEVKVSVHLLKRRKALLAGRYRWAILVVMIVLIAALVIWKLYTPYAPEPGVVPKEKIAASQLEKAPDATLPSVKVVSKEKITPPSPEKVSKTVTPPLPKEEVASKEKMAFPLPDLPSIAVLPFVNISEDPGQEFLSYGITEEITTALSKIPRIFVISRQSTFSYKGKPVKVKQVSEELGVQYVLEGSIQRSADRIRINAQLIDALTGRHIWAERYNRELTDLFALQDDITMKILRAIQVNLTEGDLTLKFTEKPSLECYLKFWEGLKYYEGFNIEATKMARRIAEETIAMCPEYPMTYVLMGFVNILERFLRIGKSPQESTEKGIEMAQKALAIDDSYSTAHALLCSLYCQKREYDKAIAEGERAIALAPSGAFAHEWYAASLSYAGRPEQAIPMFQKAIRLHPVGNTGLYLSYGAALRTAGRFEEAVSAFKKALQRAPDNILAHIGLAATYSMMGQEQEAHAEAAEVLRLNPKYSLDNYVRTLIYKDQAQNDRFIEALRKAGLK